MLSKSETQEGRARTGVVAAAACYLMWGLVPLYWKQLKAVDPIELIAHRHLWSMIVLLLLLGRWGGWSEVRTALASRSGIGRVLLGAGLLTANWLVYVWGVNTGHIVETSLGYFLVPLFSVLAGRFLLGEHLRRLQWTAVGLAAGGVALLMLQATRIPWIALMLAGTWGCYSILRKRTTLGAVPGLAVETLLLSPLAIGYLIWRQEDGTGVLGRADLKTHLLVLSSGLVTAVPLLLFAHAAPRIRLSTLGLLQYIAPTAQLMLGVWVYGESFSRSRLTSFGLIWSGLVLYTFDNLSAQRRATMARDGEVKDGPSPGVRPGRG